MTAPQDFQWEICVNCGPFVRCPRCGNNCCNAMTGTVDGVACDTCPEAYKVQDLGPPDDFKRTEAYIKWSTAEAWALKEDLDRE